MRIWLTGSLCLIFLPCSSCACLATSSTGPKKGDDFVRDFWMSSKLHFFGSSSAFSNLILSVFCVCMASCSTERCSWQPVVSVPDETTYTIHLVIDKIWPKAVVFWRRAKQYKKTCLVSFLHCTLDNFILINFSIWAAQRCITVSCTDCCSWHTWKQSWWCWTPELLHVSWPN